MQGTGVGADEICSTQCTTLAAVLTRMEDERAIVVEDEER